MALAVIVSQPRAEPSLLRPGYESGDPLWNWPTVFNSSLRLMHEAPRRSVGLQGRLTAWHPFRVKELSALVWEAGLTGSHWGGMTSGIFLSAPFSRELWLDGSLIRGFHFASAWLGAGMGWSQVEDRLRLDGLGGTGGIGVTSGRVTLTSRFALSSSRSPQVWSWRWGAGSFLRAHSSLSLQVQVAQDSADRGSVLLGVLWRVTDPGVRPSASIAIGHNLTLGTGLLRISLLTGVPGPALGLWTHVHPFLGWTPGFSLSWGRRSQ
jgi:hypothetical protein